MTTWRAAALAAALCMAWPLLAEDELTATVEVSERQTEVGWIYDYRVTNTGQVPLQEVRLGRPEGEDGLPKEPDLVVSPPGWGSSVRYEVTGRSLELFSVAWHPTYPLVPGGALQPGKTADGLSVVFKERCVPCVTTPYEVRTRLDLHPTRAVAFSGALKRVEARSERMPVVIALIHPAPGEDQYLDGMATLTATVSEPARVLAVRFEADGEAIVGTPLPDFGIRWDTKQVRFDGGVELRAIATDRDGWSYTSAPIVATLKNGHPHPACTL